MRGTDGFVDWRRAAAVADFVAARAGASAGDLGPNLVAICEESAGLVCEYARLEPRTPLATAELVERPAWVRANLDGLGSVIERPLSAYAEKASGGALGSGISRIGGFLLAVEMGGLLGYLSTRVLAQYYMVLGSKKPGADKPARLLFVRPNLVATQHKLGVQTHEFLRWITFHEVTHAVQFSACTWLNAELDRLIDEYVKRLTEHVDQLKGSRLAQSLRDPRAFIERLRSGSLSELLVTPEERVLISRAQAIMSLIEGHAEHVMHVLGKRELKSYGRLARMSAERRRRSAPERLLQRLLGLELKIRQYEQGRRFVDAVVRKNGIETLNLAWQKPENLPSLDEIGRPQSWLKRVQAA